MGKIKYLLIISLIVFSACKQAEKDGDKLYLVATTGMIKDALENMAKDKAIVFGMMGPGVDPHLYKPTPGDLSELRTADIVFYNGLHLEGKMSEVFEQLAKKKPVFAVSDGLDKSILKAPQDGSQAYDPHIWFDVSLWSKAVDHAGEKLAETDKPNAEFYLQNKVAYLKELDALHNWVTEQLQLVPEKQRVLITAHDAFGYFGRAYQVDVKGLQGISTLSEFGLRDVSQLVNFIVDNNIKAVFVETSVSTKSLETVVSGCREKGHEVKIGGTLYSDAMGPNNTPEGTYIGMVKANVNTIVSSLK
jgi:manganese/zinc/iron transport system substrate-binding protein